MKSVHALAYSRRKAEAADWHCLESWPGFQDCPRVCSGLGPGCRCWMGEGTLLEDLTLGASSPATLGTWPCFHWAGVGHWAEEMPWLTRDAGSSPSSPAPASCQGDSGRQTPGKDMTCAHTQTHPSNWSRWTRIDCLGLFTCKDVSSRLQLVTVSPNFTETEGAKQYEKTKEFTPNERTRETPWIAN